MNGFQAFILFAALWTAAFALLIFLSGGGETNE